MTGQAKTYLRNDLGDESVGDPRLAQIIFGGTSPNTVPAKLIWCKVLDSVGGEGLPSLLATVPKILGPFQIFSNEREPFWRVCARTVAKTSIEQRTSKHVPLHEKPHLEGDTVAPPVDTDRGILNIVDENVVLVIRAFHLEKSGPTKISDLFADQTARYVPSVK